MSKSHHRLDKRLWARTRRAVFDRDGYRCKLCGKFGRLECDHVLPLDRHPDQDVYALAGLQALCRSCHIAKTRKERSPRERTPSERAWHDLVMEMMD